MFSPSRVGHRCGVQREHDDNVRVADRWVFLAELFVVLIGLSASRRARIFPCRLLTMRSPGKHLGGDRVVQWRYGNSPSTCTPGSETVLDFRCVRLYGRLSCQVVRLMYHARLTFVAAPKYRGSTWSRVHHSAMGASEANIHEEYDFPFVRSHVFGTLVCGPRQTFRSEHCRGGHVAMVFLVLFRRVESIWRRVSAPTHEHARRCLVLGRPPGLSFHLHCAT